MREGTPEPRSHTASTSRRSSQYGSATPGELARRLGLSPTTLSAMIDRLVRKKQLRRVRHRDDGRSYVLEPTARRRTTNARSARRCEQTLRALRSSLDGEPQENLE